MTEDRRTPEVSIEAAFDAIGAAVGSHSQRPYADERDRKIRRAWIQTRHGCTEYRCPECKHLLCKVDSADRTPMPPTARAWCCKWWNAFRN